MGSAPPFTVALAVCGLLLGATVPAAGQERRAAPVYGELPEQRPDPSVAARKVARTPARETPRPAVPAPRPERGSAPAAEAPALGLSSDAPSTAPSIGVAASSNARAGASPAATPEPSTLILMGAGLAGLYRLRRRR